ASGAPDARGGGPQAAGNQAGQMPAARAVDDPMGALMRGMAQLQSAMTESIASRSKDEIVKPGQAELPKLPDLCSNSAIDVGDWLHGLQNHMGDLSSNSGMWWKEVLACLSRYYEAYLSASHVGKLSLRSADYESDFLKDTRWLRLDKRAASMILACIPEAVKSDILAARLAGTLPMLARIVVLYRPGSVAERQQILQALESPTAARSSTEAVNELRKWSRWMARALDMGLQPPDPSVLIKGLDCMTKSVLNDHSDVAFRISMLRYNLEVDTRPTIKGAQDLQQALLSELEQVAFRTRSGGSAAATASVKAPQPAGGGDGSPRKQKPPCKFYLTEKGESREMLDLWKYIAPTDYVSYEARWRQPDCQIQGECTQGTRATTGGNSYYRASHSSATIGWCNGTCHLYGLVEYLNGIYNLNPAGRTLVAKFLGRGVAALDLIYEIECEKLRELRSATKANAKSLWMWATDKPWAQHLETFVREGGRVHQLQAMNAMGSPFLGWSELDKSLASESIDLGDKAGWIYLRALPGSRQRRKRLMSMPWVVHLFSGPGHAVDPLFRELDDGRVLVQIDINRSKSEDLGMIAGVYRCLLWGAATGRIDGFFGSPPVKPELVQKMMWLVTVAKAARAEHGGHPVFAMFEGEKVMKLRRDADVERWKAVVGSWEKFVEATCLEEIGESIVTNLAFDGAPPAATERGSSRWTFEFKEALVQAVRLWGREPEALQVAKWVKKLDIKDGDFMESLSDKELAMWRAH
ncbi:unnamed protein product, partial [Symbiodinium necroappetens]